MKVLCSSGGALSLSHFRLGDTFLTKKPVLETGGVEFVRCEHLPRRRSLLKNAVELHYGNEGSVFGAEPCSGLKPGYLSLCCIDYS